MMRELYKNHKESIQYYGVIVALWILGLVIMYVYCNFILPLDTGI